MARQDYVMPGGLWPTTLVPAPRRLALMDDLTTRMINGDEGGEWTPSSPIAFGGLGLSSSSAATVLSGVQTGRASGNVTVDSAFPLFTTPRSRTILVPFADACSSSLAKPFKFSPQLGCAIQMTGIGGTVQLPLPALRMHDQATLSSAVLTWRVTQNHVGLPSTQPSFRIMRMSVPRNSAVDGTLVELRAGGAFFVTAANVTSYVADGAAKTLTYTPDQNGILDSECNYYAEFIDESGTFAMPGNALHSLSLNLSNIADMRPE